jgi:hypothetical protein
VLAIAVEAGIYLATAIASAQVRGGVAREQALSAQLHGNQESAGPDGGGSLEQNRGSRLCGRR